MLRWLGMGWKWAWNDLKFNLDFVSLGTDLELLGHQQIQVYLRLLEVA